MNQHHYDQLLADLGTALESDALEHSRLAEVCNARDFIITIHKSDSKRPFFINDRAKHFFGFEHNWVNPGDCALFLKNYHYTCYKNMSDAFRYLRDEKGDLFELSFKLLNRHKHWVDFKGRAGALLKDDYGRLRYSVVFGDESAIVTQ